VGRGRRSRIRARRLALDFERTNNFTLAVLETIRSLLDDEIRPAVDKWFAQKLEPLRQPLEKRREVLREMRRSVRAALDAERIETKRKQVLYQAGVIVPALVLAAFALSSVIRRIRVSSRTYICGLA